jgi:hypothetical protein
MMTPELKVACEVVFQEHKTSSHSVTWNRDAFRGRVSTGLTEMAKETLLKKNIILYPNPGKKIITVINPHALNASSFEEAEKMVHSHVAVLYPSTMNVAKTAQVAEKRPMTFVSKPLVAQRITTMAEPVDATVELKWYLRPVFTYVVWPLCAALAGVVIAHYMGALYTEIFFDLKK